MKSVFCCLVWFGVCGFCWIGFGVSAGGVSFFKLNSPSLYLMLIRSG